MGGGSVPTQMLPTWAVAMEHESVTVDQMESRLRSCRIPVIGRISKDRLLLDMRTVQEEYFGYIAQCLLEVTGGAK